MPLPDVTIYASPSVANGSGNSGATAETAVSLIDAISMAVPGSVIGLLDGVYLRSSSVGITKAGTSTNWIVFRPVNPGGATIQWTGTSNSPMFYLLTQSGVSCAFIEINGLIFDGIGVATNGIFCQKPSGVSSPFPHHFRFIDNIIHNTGSSGIATIDCDYLTAIGNRIHNVGMVRGWGSGIAYNTNRWFDADPSFHNLILNNIISGIYDCCGTNRINDPGDDTDITDGNGIIIDRSSIGDHSPPTLVANNVIYQNGGRGVITFHAGNVWVINNTFYQNLLDLLIGNDGSQLFEVGNVQIGGFSENNYVVNNITHNWTPRNSYQLMNDSDAVWWSNLWYGGVGLFGIDPLIGNDPDHFINSDPLFSDPPPVNPDPDVGEQYLDALDPGLIANHFYLQGNSPAIGLGVDPRTITGQKIILSSGAEETNVTALIDAMTTYLLTDAAGQPRPSDGENWSSGAYMASSTFARDDIRITTLSPVGVPSKLYLFQANQSSSQSFIAGISTFFGHLKHIGNISAAISGTSTVIADVVGSLSAVGSSSGTSTVTATLVGSLFIVGSSSGVSTVVGNIFAVAALSSTLSGTSTTAATAVTDYALSGNLTAAATVVGSIYAVAALSSSINGSVVVEASMLGRVEISSSIGGTSSENAVLSGVGNLVGNIDADSAIIGSILGVIDISGNIFGSSTVESDLSSAGSLVGLILGTATVESDLSSVGSLAGLILGTATASLENTDIELGEISMLNAGMWKKNQSNTILFVLVDASGNEVSGLGSSYVLQISKVGTAFTASAGVKSEVGFGWYKYVATAGEADTSGPIAVKVTGTGVIQQNLEYVVEDRVENAIEFTYTLLSDAGGNPPIYAADILVYTDSGATNFVWGGRTDLFGVARDSYGNLPRLEPGSYFFFSYKNGFSFNNPDLETVSA